MPRSIDSVLPELARFTAVGAVGFLVDSGALYAALWMGLGLYGGRLVSFICAATFTWYVNRRFTFAVRTPPTLREWLGFLIANGVGGLVNLAIYAGLVATFRSIADLPVIAVAAGSVGGLLINFILSRGLFSRPVVTDAPEH